jgi:hypothetical protein
MLSKLALEDLDQVVAGMKRSKNPYDWSKETADRVAQWKAMPKQPGAVSREPSREASGWVPDEGTARDPNRFHCLGRLCIYW